jgi:putative inorganic carbon (HCO3(-)) transporter
MRFIKLQSWRNLKLPQIITTFLQWFGIPLLVIISLTLAYGLLYFDELTLKIFSLFIILLGILIEPFIGVLLYIIFLYVRLMELLNVSMPLMKILALATLASWIFHIIIRRQRKFVNTPQNILVVALLILMIISQGTYINGMINVLTGDFARVVVIYFLIINLVNTEKRLQITIWILMVSTLWISIHGILLSKGVIIGQEGLSDGTRVTSTGIFGDPNDLAQAIVMVIPFVFSLFFYEKRILTKLILIVMGAIMLYAFLLTGSRGGFIGISVVMFLLLKRKVGLVMGSAIASIALIGLLFVAPAYTVERIMTASPYQDTGADRLELWYEGWQMFLSNPLLGVGKDRYYELTESHLVAHNSFVHIAAELGLPGLFAWIGLFYFSFKNLYKTSNLYTSDNRISRASVLSNSLMISMIGFVFTAFFLSRQYGYLPYILVALSIGAYQLADKENKSRLEFSFREMCNVLLITFIFIIGWVGLLKVFL